MENGITIFSSHARVEDFYKKVDTLEASGWTVVMDGLFENISGQKFVAFNYYHDVQRSKVAHVTDVRPLHQRVATLMRQRDIDAHEIAKKKK